MNPLMEYAVSVMLGRMQKPAGKTLISVGQGMQMVGAELETLGHALVDSAPATPVPPKRVSTPGWRPRVST